MALAPIRRKSISAACTVARLAFTITLLARICSAMRGNQALAAGLGARSGRRIEESLRTAFARISATRREAGFGSQTVHWRASFWFSPSILALQAGRIKTAATPRDLFNWTPQDDRSAPDHHGGPCTGLRNRLHPARPTNDNLQLLS